MSDEQCMRHALVRIVEEVEGARSEEASAALLRVYKLATVGLYQVPGKNLGAPAGASGATEEDTGLLARVKAIEARLSALEHPGTCPECKADVSGWRMPTGAVGPEMWATLRERGIDPATGHRKTCSRGSK